MKTNYQIFIGLIAVITLLLFSGCEEDNSIGACETKSSSGGYWCDEMIPAVCTGSSTYTAYFHSDKTCSDIGYTVKKSTGSWESPQGYSYPGIGGHWASSSGNCSLSNYTGPTADVQSASFCQAAYVYKCSGNTAGVTSTCNTYKQFKQMTPSLPSCPYCN